MDLHGSPETRDVQKGCPSPISHGLHKPHRGSWPAFTSTFNAACWS